jgi:predicted ATP-dependent serine protease
MKQLNNPININLFAGPGVGKSTIAAELFSTLKRQHKKVELVTEYAKDITYRGDYNTLSDQLYLLGKQHNKLHRLLKHDLDIIVHDSPFVMGINYVMEDQHIPINLFKQMTLELFNSYRNINIILMRNPNVEYQQIGRNQTLEQAIELDNKITSFLCDNNISCNQVMVDENCIENILYWVKYHTSHKGWKF